MDPESRLRQVGAALADPDASPQDLLEALTALRLLREEMTAWEPELISAARAKGVSWAALAPALGVASRQAAERRYLRLNPSSSGEATGEGRVRAQRDRRAGERAVATWARENSGSLRRLAGQVSAAGGLDSESAGRVERALGDNDAAALLSPLAEANPRLGADHQQLAAEVAAVTEHTDRLRRDAIDSRRPVSGGTRSPGTG
ncbi:HSP18 transcriptional regulator [Amycolatopsis albispora]|uniref:HSP18 transcriptional regulator n=1 Tax=Amycolatopsis albispora TaxID=1804986 RepID=A0A344L6V0_9PSEU|nr:HSP18 transcriptional regulator [Amycolatopsis albispora]AXB43774.1 HSP18 transcriptional regulator [Amycolatopsis albispora]